MKQKIEKVILNSWMNQKSVMIAALLFILCPFLSSLKPPAVCKQIPIATANPRPSTSKSAREIEYDVKAAFIYNFIKFVEWPKEKKAEEDKQQKKLAPIIIGVLGDSPFGSSFVAILGKEIKSRAIHFIEIDSYDAYYKSATDKSKAWEMYREHYQGIVQKCDVLFICDSEKKHVNKLTSLTDGNMILTISDIPRFAQDVGIVGFVKERNKVRFEVNLENANKENIKIRSQLLNLAKKVYQKK